MRPIITTAICALTAAAMAAPAFAAADYYLKLGDIKGEASAKSAPEKKIEIQSWSFGATNPGAAKVPMHDVEVTSAAALPDPNSQRLAVSDPGASGPKATGKRQHGSVTITKPLDRGSVTVKGKLAGCTVGAAYADAVLQTAYIRYELKDVMVSSCSVSGWSSSGGPPSESVTLNYSSYRESPTRASQK